MDQSGTESTYRQRYRASGADVTVREPDEVDADEGIMELRLPIATTGRVRNEGDDPLTRDELDGMARQLSTRQIGVFPAHGGDTMIAADRYSPFEKLGEWADAEIDGRDNEDVLVATARMPDPGTLPDATGEYRKGLAILKEQAKRGIAQDASIGWRDDEGFSGGVDLMEASIVGIGADWRTNTGDEAAEVVARAAVASGADADALVEQVRTIVSERNLDDPAYSEGDAVTWTWDESPVHGRVADVGDEFTVSGNTITGEEGEAVYLIHEWDEDVEAFRRENVAKPESSLSDSSMEMPSATEDNFQNMTEDDTADDGGTTEEQDASTDDAETQSEAPAEVRMSAAEVSDMAEDIVMGHIEAAMDEIESELAEAMDGEDNEMDGDKEDEDDDDEDDDDDEMSADSPDNEQDASESESEESAEDDDTRDLESEVEDLRSELDKVRSGEIDIEQPNGGVDDEAKSDSETETEQRETTDADAAPAGPNWRSD